MQFYQDFILIYQTFKFWKNLSTKFNIYFPNFYKKLWDCFFVWNPNLDMNLNLKKMDLDPQH